MNHLSEDPMATLGNLEEQSTSRLPFFYGNDYSNYKARMRICLQDWDYEFWEIVTKGPKNFYEKK